MCSRKSSSSGRRLSKDLEEVGAMQVSGGGGSQEAPAESLAGALEELKEAGVVQAVSRRTEKMKSAR